jgi:hypothetical protein
VLANRVPTELRALIKTESRVEQERSLFCERYGSCLDEAVEKGWASWTCARCPAFAGEPGPERRRAS